MKTKKGLPAEASAKAGSGLIFAVVLLFVILGMVITLSSITVLETKMNQKTKSSVGAFYNSESGVEWALNQIATKSGTAQISTIGACPFTGCNVLFLDKDGKVLASSSTIDQVKAVRSVGTQNGETQRAIEAAVASGGVSYTYYCFNNGNRGTPVCPASVLVGTQGPCESGFKVVKDLGSWGQCSRQYTEFTIPGSTVVLREFYFLPPGGGCGTGNSVIEGKAYLCSQ